MPPRRSRRLAALCGLVSVLLLAATPAHAADRIYWSNMNANVISWANLDGSGGGNLAIDPSLLNGPMGLALDSATGKIYWANFADGHGTTIGVANLDGSDAHILPISGGGVSDPHGVAVDPVTQKLYWTNCISNDPLPCGPSWIGYANAADGSGGGTLNTAGATIQGPRGLALDPVARKIYWANWNGNGLSVANLDGSGGTDFYTGSATVDHPEGVALSPAQNRLYYGNFTPNPNPPHETISYINLNGSGGADLPTPGATRDEPHGVAIDPTTGRIYWPNFALDIISWAKLDGSGGQDLPTPNAMKDGPNLPVLLKVPAPSGPAAILGRFAPRSSLTCNGNWAPDQTASLMYQAPQTTAYSWAEKGRKLNAQSATLKPRSLGEFRCASTGQNAAGTASNTGRWYGVFSISRPKLNLRGGTATLDVTVPGPGRISLTGSGVARRADLGPVPLRAALARRRPKSKTRTVAVVVRAKGSAKRRLRRKGSVRLSLDVVFKPAHGAASPQPDSVRLREKR